MSQHVAMAFELLLVEGDELAAGKRAVLTMECASKLAECAAYDLAGNDEEMTVARLILMSEELLRMAERVRKRL